MGLVWGCANCSVCGLHTEKGSVEGPRTKCGAPVSKQLPMGIIKSDCTLGPKNFQAVSGATMFDENMRKKNGKTMLSD